MSHRYCYIWEYQVVPEQRAAFLAAYGSEGDWVQLFRRANGYLGTLLVRDLTDPDRYITLDRWASRQAHELFLEDHHAAYVALDARCARLTSAETLVGHFEEP